MADYHSPYKVGEAVRICTQETLLQYQSDWGEYYHKPTDEQISFAERVCLVKAVFYEHGGDALYALEGFAEDPPTSSDNLIPIPGIWHEDCVMEEMSGYFPIGRQKAHEVYTVQAETRNMQPVIVIRDLHGAEYLVRRSRRNVEMATEMNRVATFRCTLGFEQRYDFEGLALDEYSHREIS